jgi:hypothetical protein
VDYSLPIVRTLAAAPRDFVDRATGRPAFGSYAGPLPRVELDGSFAERVLRRKRWWWLALASDEVWISLAVVRMGYACSAFAFAYDRSSGRMLADRAVVAPPGAASVADDPHAIGELARFALGGSRVSLVRRSEPRGAVDLRAKIGGLALDATIAEGAAPPSISAIARLSSGASATEKRALAGVRGAASIGGRRVSLDGGLAAYDYTHGLLPRHTRWKWAFGMGRARGGAPIAFNVVDGFVGEAECAAFLGGRVLPLAEPRIEGGADDPHGRWRLVGDGVDLAFDVGAVHAQHTNLGLVRSRFVQPVGSFRGTLRLGGADVELDGVPGVVEDQDVLW